MQTLKWIGLAIALVFTPGFAHAAPGPDASWHLIVAESGDVIGRASHETVERPDGLEIRETNELRVRQADDPSTVIASETVTLENSEGRVVSIADTSQTGREWSRLTATIGAESATIVRETRGDRRQLTVDLPPDIRFDSGAALLADWDFETVPRLEFMNFSIGAMGVERVVIEPAPGETRGDNGERTLLRKRYDGDQLRGIARLVIDAEGNVIELVQPMFGTNVIVQPVDRETAMRSYPPYRVINNAMVRAPYRISGASMHARIRYNFGFEQGIAFEIPETGDQRVRLEPDGATLDICEGCGPGLPTDTAYLERARQPTAWMQSDHPRLRALTAIIADEPVSDRRKMEMLMVRADPFIEDIDFAGHFSALEILSRRSGDCTESAVLLAALGRAAGIPTMVASGLVYSRGSYHGMTNVFMPHSWVLAYVDDEWRSFDLALDEFDSTHIALTIGEGDERSIHASIQLASLLEWRQMSEVRPRPAE